MLTTSIELSSFKSLPLTSNNFEYKQYSKLLEGNFQVNQTLALSALEDFKRKNYTNFFLTGNVKLSDILEVPKSNIKAETITSTLKIGDVYLSFSEIDPTPYIYTDDYKSSKKYGAVDFKNGVDDTCIFEITLYFDNSCKISYVKQGVKYNLCSDESSNLFFIKESEIPDNGISYYPNIFKYIFNDNYRLLNLFQIKDSGSYQVTKNGNTLSLSLDYDKYSIFANSFELSRDISKNIELDVDSDYISYNADNNLNLSRSDFGLTNNFLLHKKSDNTLELIVLKNQASQSGTFNQGNNLLSGSNEFIQYSENRKYTSIFQEIDKELDDSLILNYVFFNKEYVIKPGINTFISPSSMSPYTQLNVNDTKFVNNGSFSYPTPEYADKIYSTDTGSYNGATLLCTWLSGYPSSSNKVWVDRYYYPDLITKQAAISGLPLYADTYDNYIESLIFSNSTNIESANVNKFFDKKSDMCFYPNKKYIYDRISSKKFTTDIVPTFSQCQIQNNENIASVEDINDSGRMTVVLYFEDDRSSWNIASKYNKIDQGLTIDKGENLVTVTYKVFDNSKQTTTIYTTTSLYKKYKTNYLVISIDTIKGIYYVFLNEDIVDQYNLPVLQQYKKPIINGDFVFNNETVLKTETPTIVKKITVTNEFIKPELAFTSKLVDGEDEIPTISITLPCGMRNSSDDIQYISALCTSESFKSNYINVIVKNMNIDSDLEDVVEADVRSTIASKLPVGTIIDTVTFENYKNE